MISISGLCWVNNEMVGSKATIVNERRITHVVVNSRNEKFGHILGLDFATGIVCLFVCLFL